MVTLEWHSPSRGTFLVGSDCGSFAAALVPLERLLSARCSPPSPLTPPAVSRLKEPPSAKGFVVAVFIQILLPEVSVTPDRRPMGGGTPGIPPHPTHSPGKVFMYYQRGKARAEASPALPIPGPAQPPIQGTRGHALAASGRGGGGDSAAPFRALTAIQKGNTVGSGGIPAEFSTFRTHFEK